MSALRRSACLANIFRQLQKHPIEPLIKANGDIAARSASCAIVRTSLRGCDRPRLGSLRVLAAGARNLLQ